MRYNISPHSLIMEQWRSSIPNFEWDKVHPGYQFKIIAGGKVVGMSPDLPKARVLARQHFVKSHTTVVIKDQEGRTFFTLREGLMIKESPETDLLTVLKSVFPKENLRILWDVAPLIDWNDLKFQVSLAKRMKYADVYVKATTHTFMLPLAMAELLVRSKQQGIRSLKKYVNKRW